MSDAKHQQPQINGIRTKGENIADNGGLKHSFAAFTRWLATHGDDKFQMPGIIDAFEFVNISNSTGISYTPEQLFFVNYAQIWCGKMNDYEARRKVRSSEHPPGLVRYAFN